MPRKLLEIDKFQVGIITTPSETDIPPDAASYSLNIDPVSEDGVLKSIPSDSYINHFGFTDTRNSISAIDYYTTGGGDSYTGFKITCASNHRFKLEYIGQKISIAGIKSDGRNINGVYELSDILSLTELKFETSYVTDGGLDYENAVFNLLPFAGGYSTFKIFKIYDKYNIVGFNTKSNSIVFAQNIGSSSPTDPRNIITKQVPTLQGTGNNVTSLVVHNNDSYIGLGGNKNTKTKWIGKPKHSQFFKKLGWSVDNSELNISTITEFPQLIERMYVPADTGFALTGELLVYAEHSSSELWIAKGDSPNTEFVGPFGGTLFNSIKSITSAGLWVFVLNYDSNTDKYSIIKLNIGNLDSPQEFKVGENNPILEVPYFPAGEGENLQSPQITSTRVPIQICIPKVSDNSTEFKANSGTSTTISNGIDTGYYTGFTLTDAIIQNMSDPKSSEDFSSISEGVITADDNDGDWTFSTLTGGTTNSFGSNDYYWVGSPKMWIVYGNSMLLDTSSARGVYGQSHSDSDYGYTEKHLSNFDWREFSDGDLDYNSNIAHRDIKLHAKRRTSMSFQNQAPEKGDFSYIAYRYDGNPNNNPNDSFSGTGNPYIQPYDARAIDWGMHYTSFSIVPTRDISKIGFITKYGMPSDNYSQDVGENPGIIQVDAGAHIFIQSSNNPFNNSQYTYGTVARVNNPMCLGSDADQGGTDSTLTESNAIVDADDPTPGEHNAGWHLYGVDRNNVQTCDGAVPSSDNLTPFNDSLPIPRNCDGLYSNVLNIISNTHTRWTNPARIKLDNPLYDGTGSENPVAQGIVDLEHNKFLYVNSVNEIHYTKEKTIDLTVNNGDYHTGLQGHLGGGTGGYDTNDGGEDKTTLMHHANNVKTTNFADGEIGIFGLKHNPSGAGTDTWYVNSIQGTTPNIYSIVGLKSLADAGTFDDLSPGTTDNILNGGNATFSLAKISPSTTTFEADLTYYYKITCMYDGFQESPLSTETETTESLSISDGDSIKVTLLIKDVSKIRPRLSHINIYRAKGGTTDGEDESFRLVKQISLNDGSWSDSADGLGKTMDYVDTNTSEASYEAINGVKETLEHTTINYGLSTVINDSLIVADAYCRGIDDASNYIFKSKPGIFSQFDWSRDFLRLPHKPVALASFQGKIFAFTATETYIINPNGLYIEDVFEGVGCISSKSIAVSEFGMCFADVNNIYFHDGRKPIPIANGILRNDTYSWDQKNTSKNIYKLGLKNIKVAYYGRTGSYIVTFYDNTATPVSKCWVYTMSKKRWDLWEIPENYHLNSLDDGSIVISTDNELLRYQGHFSNKRKWDWTSKKLTLNSPTQEKKLTSFKVNSNADISDESFTLKLNNADSSGTQKTITYGGSYQQEYKVTSNSTFLEAQLIFSQITGTTSVDALAFIYRQKAIK